MLTDVRALSGSKNAASGIIRDLFSWAVSARYTRVGIPATLTQAALVSARLRQGVPGPDWPVRGLPAAAAANACRLHGSGAPGKFSGIWRSLLFS